MLIRVCDCCGKEMKKDFIRFNIHWEMTSNDERSEPTVQTPFLEYCEKCFSDALQKLGLDKE